MRDVSEKDSIGGAMGWGGDTVLFKEEFIIGSKM